MPVALAMGEIHADGFGGAGRAGGRAQTNFSPKVTFQSSKSRNDKGKRRTTKPSTDVARAALASKRARRGSAGSLNENLQDEEDSLFSEEPAPMVVEGNPDVAKQEKREEKLLRTEQLDKMWNEVQPELVQAYVRMAPSRKRRDDEELQQAKEAFAQKVRMN